MGMTALIALTVILTAALVVTRVAAERGLAARDQATMDAVSAVVVHWDLVLRDAEDVGYRVDVAPEWVEVVAAGEDPRVAAWHHCR